MEFNMTIEKRLIGGQLLAVDQDTDQLSVTVSEDSINSLATEDTLQSVVTLLGTTGIKVNGVTVEIAEMAIGDVGILASDGVTIIQPASQGDIQAIGTILGSPAQESGGNLAALLAAQKPYSNVLAGYLSLSGSEEPLIPGWVIGTAFLAANFCTHAGKVYYALQNTTGHEPGLAGSAAYWQEVTPRAMTLWVNDGGSDVKRGSALRQESTLFAGGMKEKLSVDTTGLLAMYIIGTAAGTLEMEVYE